VFHFRCPKCAAALRTAADQRGAAVTCPRCHQRLRVPEQDPEPEPERQEAEEGEEAPAAVPRRRRRRRMRRGGTDGVAAWLGGRMLGWVIGGVSLLALNLAVCCGYFGWAYVNMRLHHHRAAEPVEAVEAMPAAQLLRDYQADPAVADAHYKDHLVEVTGIIEAVRRDGPQNWRVVLRADGDAGPLRIECLFSDVDKDEADDLGQLEVGEQVGIQGRCAGRPQHVQLRDCELTD
jgi:hypothetical protein